MSGYKILIADDHVVVRQGVSFILKDAFENLTLFQAPVFSKLVEILKEQLVDMVILDISIPEGKGVQMVDVIKEIQPDVRILVFSALEEDIYGLRYLKAGAGGYLNKLTSEEEFKRAFTAMLEKGCYLSESLQHKISEKSQSGNPLNLLSNRELEIATYLMKGEGNLEIANRLSLQNSTVSTYKNRIFEKLNITNTVALFELFKLYRDILE